MYLLKSLKMLKKQFNYRQRLLNRTIITSNDVIFKSLCNLVEWCKDFLDLFYLILLFCEEGILLKIINIYHANCDYLRTKLKGAMEHKIR